jgi:hypothetical protein
MEGDHEQASVSIQREVVWRTPRSSGVLFILDNFASSCRGLWDYWPLFLIGPGIARLIQPAGRGTGSGA